MSNEAKWRAELEGCDILAAELGKLYVHANDYNRTDATYGERNKEVREIKKEQKRVKAKRNRLKRKLAELDGPVKHYDHFGQEICVGCQVVWCNSSGYARVHVAEVTGTSYKTVQLGVGTNINPDTLIVVDKLIAAQQEREDVHGRAAKSVD